jgi:XisH protein
MKKNRSKIIFLICSVFFIGIAIFFSSKNAQNNGADFAAEKFIIAEKNTEKILVEIKSFITSSNINELHHSVGQYDFYALLLEEQEPNRIPFLAMPKDAYDDLIREPIVQTFLDRHNVKLIIFDVQNPIIHAWKR